MANTKPLSVSRKHVIFSEIQSVTSVMRKNSRWASSSQLYIYASRDEALASSLGLRRATGATDTSPLTARQEVQLMAGFLNLKREVRNIDNLDDLPLTVLFQPFFAIIRSPLSTGPITSAALSSLHTFFVTGFVTDKSKELDIALSELSNTVSNCKFEASDASGDEVVLYRIMAVIKECMCCAVGDRLGDIEICEMLETVLTTCCQMRLSEILRRYAESIMHALVRQIFQRLRSLDPVEEEVKLAKNEDDSENELKMTVNTKSGHGEKSSSSLSEKNLQHMPESGDSAVQQENSGDITTAEASIPTKLNYGLPSIIELLRVVVNILDPNDRMHTDSTRLVALRVLNTAFEVAGYEIGQYPSLVGLIQDHGCKYLFQLARSDNPAVLYMALRVIASMFETMVVHLKLQQELFLTFTIDRLLPPGPSKVHLAAQSRSALSSPRPGTPIPSTPIPLNNDDVELDNIGPSRPPIAPAKGETRELILETLSHISRHPSFMVELYANYDCDVNCEDLFEKLIDFLTKGVYTSQTSGREVQQQTTQMLCLDLLLEFVKSMSERASGNAEPWPTDHPDPASLLQSKSRKRLIMTGASRFNTKPKVGLSFLEENKLIYADLSEEVDRPKSLARFLKSCTRLNKRLLGDFISRPENVEVLRAFIRLFDFKNKPISEAMRELLESFRLPGEAQQIARITENFAEVYFDSKPADIKSQDAVYVLAYSVIMLNTDLHNPQNRKRMTLEDYQRNLRGVNDNTDFPADYLRAIYESIRKNEIVMPEEHTGQLGFEYAWKELLVRSRLSGQFRTANSSDFDLHMFKSVWKPVISTIAYAFTTFDDDYTVQQAISGFRQCAILAGRFNLPEIFDYVVVSLSQVTNLVPEELMTRVPHYPVIEVEDQDVTVSPLSIQFGTNFKGQLAAVVLFTIINGNGNAIREGWTPIFEIFENLFLNSLLSPKLLQQEEFLSGSSVIPLHATQPTPRPAGRGDGGLLSALSSYLMTPYGSNHEAPIPEATDSEIESTLCTIDCITACKLDELYAQISQLDSEALVASIRALEALAHERTVARLKQESDDLVPPNSPSGRRKEPPPQTLSYDPASVYLLETMISITLRAPQYIEELWPILFEHLSALLSSASQYSMILIEHAVVGLWRLCLVIAERPYLRDQLYVSLDTLAGLPPPVINAVGEQLVSGLSTLVKTHKSIIRSAVLLSLRENDFLTLIRSQTEWSIVFSLIRATMPQPVASRQSFELLVNLTEEGPNQSVSSDNFHGLINILDEFASAAGRAVEAVGNTERRKGPEAPQDEHVQRGKKSVELIFELRRFISHFAKTMHPNLVWKQYSVPLLTSLARQSTNASREVRNLALVNLQRILLGQFIEVDQGPEQADYVFNHIIFTLIDDLLRPQVFQRDPRGMSETRLRASVLLCKVFMHLQVNDSALQRDIRVLWIQILDLLDRLMNVDRKDQLREAIPESLKNVVLVMNTTGMLVPPSSNDQRTQLQKSLWDVTHERVERFLPGFMNEVLPSPSSQPEANVQKPEASDDAKEAL